MSIESGPLPLDRGDRTLRARAHRAAPPRTLDVTAAESNALRSGVVLAVVLGWAAFVYAAYVLGLR